MSLCPDGVLLVKEKKMENLFMQLTRHRRLQPFPSYMFDLLFPKLALIIIQSSKNCLKTTVTIAI